MVALFFNEHEVYQRADDGTWSPMEGVVLPATFGGSGLAAGVLVPADFADGYECM